MRRTVGRLACALLVTIPLLGAAPAQAAGPRALTARDIHPAGWMSSTASDVNERGEVIITATDVVDSEIQPPLSFVWRNGRHTTLRPLPGGNASLARDINERGEVVGFCGSVTLASRPCLWRRGRPVDLGTLDERGTGTALAVNDKGAVVGDNQTYIRGGETRAFIWRHGVLTDLGGIGDRSAVGINNRGQVIGTHFLQEGNRAFLWERGVLTDLGTLGGADAMATDINERGQIVGSSTTADGIEHAFLWQDGRMIDIGPPTVGSGALAINERGQVIGYRFREDNGLVRSFRWHRGVYTPMDLYLGDINERGWIGATTADETRRVLLLRNGRTVAGGPGAAVMAINDRGTLTGWTILPDNISHATVWR